MLVVAVNASNASPDRLPWVGRRHDDDGTESTGPATAQGLFDTVFAALHDGEQVAVGFDCPLTRTADDADEPDLDEMRRLLHEIGTWRPWTVLTTSLARWRATTSVLVWEAAGPGPIDGAAAIDAFYALLRSGRKDADEPDADVRNLAAAIAVESDATADRTELTRPALRVTVG